MTNRVNIYPFVKWAGGKRQLIPQIIERIPAKYGDYYEPFVGGGAVLFSLLPERATINDINKSLINAYIVIRDNPKLFIEAIQTMDNNIVLGDKEYYYLARERYNDKLVKGEYDVEMAALIVFLNKHCFNGLYRVNKKGLFNVPYNNSHSKTIDEGNVYAVSKYLKNIEIRTGDFEDACNHAKEGDFVFFDSPYALINSNTFDSYAKENFDVGCHKRLAQLFDRLTSKGCYCMLTNHNTDLIHELYGNKGYRIDTVCVRRMINSDATKRVGEEVIICNY